MRRSAKVAVVLTGLTLAALVAMVLTSSWGNAGDRLRKLGTLARKNGAAVDTRPLDAAQQLEQLAVTRTEKGYAADAMRLGDYSVDYAFAAAIRQAAYATPPSDTATGHITERLQNALDNVADDSMHIDSAAAAIAHAKGAEHDALQQRIDVLQAQRELNQDDVEDARQDLMRAGGDRLGSIAALRTQHDSSLHATSATAAAATNAATPAPAPSIELTKDGDVVDQAGAWFSINAKKKQLEQTRQATLDRVATLSQAHDTLEKQLAAEKAQQQILHSKGRNAGNVVMAKAATAAADPKKPAAHVDSSPTPPSDEAVTSHLEFLRDLTVDQKDLSELDKRIANEQDLAAVYGSWSGYLELRQQKFVHGLIVDLFWVLLIALIIVGANAGVHRVFSDAAVHRRLHTMRTVILFAVQGGGILAILLVIFGMPNNFATVIALAGAGLALALQDFIVGFFGWFVLMGKDGIRPGDWVEINGVGGEVLEVGVFQTVLLETSNWSESADPTGRQVSFVNSFAIEGHYFNFSTSGQWLWDELEIQVPEGADPYDVAEEIQKLAAAETAANVDVAAEEWKRAVPARVRQAFSAVPSVRVKPSGGSVSVVVRYLTQASDRQAVRARMYKAMIALMHGHGAQGPEPKAQGMLPGG